MDLFNLEICIALSPYIYLKSGNVIYYIFQVGKKNSAPDIMFLFCLKRIGKVHNLHQAFVVPVIPLRNSSVMPLCHDGIKITGVTGTGKHTQ